jgi:hypothetical protein
MLGSDGTSVTGVRGGDIFLYTARQGPFHANPAEKFVVLLAKLPANPRALSLNVHVAISRRDPHSRFALKT